MVFLARLFIRGYQILLSPVLSLLEGPGGGCRFEPTCSAYFLEALETHGIWRGTWLGLCRLARCHPWGGRAHHPGPARPHPGFDACAYDRTAQRTVPTVCE